MSTIEQRFILCYVTMVVEHVNRGCAMDNVRFITGIVLCFIFYMLVTGFWMKLAAFIGDKLGISRILYWLWGKINNCFQ